MRDIVKASKALSNETRLRILSLLLVRECCVCEVMQALNISQARASRNLGILYDAGFLKMRRDGLWSLYSIDEENSKEYCTDMTNTIRKALAKNKVAIKDEQRLRTAERVGPRCVTETRT